MNVDLCKILKLARSKGLLVRANGKGGYAVTLPMGSTYHAKNIVDFSSYVKDY